MKKNGLVVVVLLVLGCSKGWDPGVLYNEGVALWNQGKRGYALWYAKKAYLVDPGQEAIRHTYERMRLEFADKPPMNPVALGVRGVNRLSWFALGCLAFAGGVVILRHVEASWVWIRRVQTWPFLRQVMIILYLVGGALFLMQALVAVRIFFPEPAVVVEEGKLLDRPENEGLVLESVATGTEGWISRRHGAYVLFRSEEGKEGWITTNKCWGIW
ncbi:MAG: hypothetical protein N2314_00630 [Brevinematales bacterium]|nr:hypothetical protein [Brevinematales bacterium]